MKYCISIISTALLLSACGGKTSPSPVNLPFEPEIDLGLTDEVDVPEQSMAYAFVPNNVAQWRSQIVVLAEDGDLYHTSADQQMAFPFAEIGVRDVIGLSRNNRAGAFLAIKGDGSVQPFVEINDLGRFGISGEPIPDVELNRFCRSPSTPVDEISGLDPDGNLKTYDVISDDDNFALSQSQSLKPPKNTQLCFHDSEQALYAKTDAALFVEKGGKWDKIADSSASYMAILPSEEGDILVSAFKGRAGVDIAFLKTPGEIRQVAITQGITIPGVNNPSGVYTVTENFGGPFNNGLVLVSDADDDRFVLISADYARDNLKSKP